MTAISKDLRIDIREAVSEAVVFIESVAMGLEMVLVKSTERDVKIRVGALSHFVTQAAKVVDELASKIDELNAEVENGEEDDTDPALGAAMDALRFYAGRAGGERAKKALAVIQARGDAE
jgi:hypothetical protein